MMAQWVTPIPDIHFPLTTRGQSIWRETKYAPSMRMPVWWQIRANKGLSLLSFPRNHFDWLVAVDVNRRSAPQGLSTTECCCCCREWKWLTIFFFLFFFFLNFRCRQQIRIAESTPSSTTRWATDSASTESSRSTRRLARFASRPPSTTRRETSTSSPFWPLTEVRTLPRRKKQPDFGWGIRMRRQLRGPRT